MEIDVGTIAVAIAVKNAAIAPPLLTAVDPIPERGADTRDATSRGPKLPELVIPVPDADTIASMQLISKIPREVE